MQPLRQTPAPKTIFRLTGWIGGYLTAVTEHWLKAVPTSNPGILGMFRDRERNPRRDLLPWSGEFAGKYLTSAVQIYRLTGDPELRTVIENFVHELLPLQTASGYLGPWPEASGLSGDAVNPAGQAYKTWDAWGHYHVMLGLMLWSDTSGDQAALACAQRIGDLLCATFETRRLVDIGSSEMNLAPIHSLCLLHARTGNERHLRLALKIRDEFAATDADGKSLAGDYLNAALAGKEFFQTPRPRWESLHPIMGLAALHHLTGDASSRAAVEQIWWSIAQWDRHNNGGFSSGERACGNPYDKGVIETCCTIAWSALGVEMLRLTDDPVVADELELAVLNSVTGLHSPSGRWATYNTPMDGVRKASAHDIVFQAREGAPELNCCSVNSARGFGLISEWAVSQSGQDVTLNWYGPGSISVPLAGGNRLTLEQETNYPAEGRVRLTLGLDRRTRFSLRLRIPHWSRTTQVRVNGGEIPQVEPGCYLRLERDWTPGDVVTVEFDFSLQFWSGERDYAGKTSIYRGPLLLTYDRRHNPFDPDQIPRLDAQGLVGKVLPARAGAPPFLLVEFATSDGRAVRLCDFGSAGADGSPYRSWLEVANTPPAIFARKNPRRSAPAK